MISYDDFQKVDIRVGKIISVEDFPEARNPAYVLMIDFGEEIGVKKSTAQLPAAQSKEDLLGTLVAAVINFEPKQVGPHTSQVLTLGFPDESGNYVVISPIKGVPLGGKLA